MATVNSAAACVRAGTGLGAAATGVMDAAVAGWSTAGLSYPLSGILWRPRSSKAIEKHQVDEATIFHAVPKAGACGVPKVRLDKNQTVVAHRNAEKLFPLAPVEGVLLEDVGVELIE